MFFLGFLLISGGKPFPENDLDHTSDGHLSQHSVSQKAKVTNGNDGRSRRRESSRSRILIDGIPPAL